MPNRRVQIAKKNRSIKIILISFLAFLIGCYLLFYESTDIDAVVDSPFDNTNCVIIGSLLIPISAFIAIITAVYQFYPTKKRRSQNKRIFFDIKNKEDNFD